MPRIEYIFLLNPNNLGLPSLIELSARASTRLDDLYFCLERVVHPRLQMHALLKMLKFPCMLNDNERGNVLMKLIEVTKEHKDIMFTEEDYFKLVINVIMETKVKSKINNNAGNKAWTRQDSKKCDITLNILHEKRSNQWMNKNNYKFTFKEEHCQSTNDLVHLFEKHY